MGKTSRIHIQFTPTARSGQPERSVFSLTHHPPNPLQARHPPFTHTHTHTAHCASTVPSVSAAAPSASSGRTPCRWHSKSQLSPHSRPSPRALGRDVGSAPAGRLAVHILGAMAPGGPSLGTGYRKADHGSCIRVGVLRMIQNDPGSGERGRDREALLPFGVSCV